MTLDAEVTKSLLTDIEERGGLYVYKDHTRTNILDSLLQTFPDLYGLCNSYRKRQCQNITTRWKKLTPDGYLEVLQTHNVSPHPQTLKRKREISNEQQPLSPVAWYPLSTDKLVEQISRSVPASSNLLVITRSSPSAAPNTRGRQKRNRAKENPTEPTTVDPTPPQETSPESLPRTSPKSQPTTSPKSESKMSKKPSGEEKAKAYPPGFDENRCRK